jgi:hypothetical protein
MPVLRTSTLPIHLAKGANDEEAELEALNARFAKVESSIFWIPEATRRILGAGKDSNSVRRSR